MVRIRWVAISIALVLLLFISSGIAAADTKINGYKLDDSGQRLNGWIIYANHTVAGHRLSAVTGSGSWGTGYYEFSLPQSGTWMLTEGLQSGYLPKSPPGGTTTISLSYGAHKTVNFTNEKQRGSISGYVLNYSTNLGIPSWPINLTSSSGFTTSTMTDTSGYYQFTTLAWDTYNVSEEMVPGYIPVTPTVQVITINGTNLNAENINFVNEVDSSVSLLAGGTVSGYKFDISTGTPVPLAGWNITLIDQTQGSIDNWTFTNNTGYYSLTAGNNGRKYISEVLPSGWIKVSPAGDYLIEFPKDDGTTNYNFTNRGAGNISGYKVYPNSTGITGWQITLNNSTNSISRTCTTAANGYYIFENLPFYYYQLNETLKAGWTQDPTTPNRTVQINATTPSLIRQNFTNFQTPSQLGNISGYKVYPNSTGIAGWQITLNNSTNSISRTCTTAANGYYIFENLPLYYYQLNETLLAGWTQDPTTPNRTVQINTTTPSLIRQNFTNYLTPLQLGNISGYKTYLNGTGILNWNITLYNQSNAISLTCTTAVNGYYIFENLPYAIYQLNETPKPGWAQHPTTPNRTVEINATSPSLTNQNFINEPIPTEGKIIGFKWNDTNHDGKFRIGEPFLPGWTIELRNATGGLLQTTTTDANGTYSFSGLDNQSTYIVCEVLNGSDLYGPWYNSTQRCQTISFVDDVACGGNETVRTCCEKCLEDRMPPPQVAFGAESRYGNNALTAPGGGCNSNHEMELMYPIGQVYNQGNTYSFNCTNRVWTNTTVVPFSLTYYPTNYTAVYTIGSDTISGNITIYPGTDGQPRADIQDIVIRTRAVHDFTRVNITNMVLTIPSPAISYNVQNYAYAEHITADCGKPGTCDPSQPGCMELEILYIRADSILNQISPGTSISQGFTLTGNMMFEWDTTGSHGQEPLPFELLWDIYVGKVRCPSNNLQFAEFGNWQRIGFISGAKWNDINGNGQQDPGDIPLGNWTICAMNQSNPAEVYCNTTNNISAQGEYLIAVPYGPSGSTFIVSEILKPGWQQTYPQSPPNWTVTISNTSLFSENNDFGNRLEEKTYCINGTKWECTSGVTISGWNITVYNQTSGLEVGNTTTISDGYYEICGLVPGNYTICEEARPGWTNLTPACHNFTIVDSNETFDFKNAELTCAWGYKINKATGQGLEGWNITARNSTTGLIVGWNLTDDRGYFQICNLTPGYSYRVCEEVKDGWTADYPGDCINLGVIGCYGFGEIRFTNIPPATYCIDGYKYEGSEGTSGLEGWNITVTNTTSQQIVGWNITDDSGYWKVCNLPNGTYKVCEVLDNHPEYVNITSLCYDIIIKGADNRSPEFRNELKTYCINGTKTNCTGQSNDGCPLDGWKMTVYNQTSGLEVRNDTTDAKGYYEICGLVPGDYWVCEEERPGFTNLTPACLNFTIEAGNLTFDIRNAKLTCIDGRKFNNATRQGLPGWNITVKNTTSGLIVGWNQTDETGYFQICNLTPGYNYTVCEELKNGWTSIDGLTCVDVDDLACFGAYIEFWNDPPPTHCLNGTKTNCTGSPLDGWKMTVYNMTGEVGNNTTHNGGYYEVCGLAPGDYWVCEENKPGYVNITPICQNFTISDTDVTRDFQNAETGSSMNITKKANVTGTVSPGQGIGYTITVCNTGNWTLSNVTVADSLFGSTVIGTLAKGECTSIYPNLTVSEQDVCRGWINNTAFANATDPCGGSVVTDPNATVSLPVDYNASVTITKTADTTGPVGLNDIITYNITVCNTGNMTLDVQVFDNRTSTYTVTGLPKGQCNTTSRPYLVTGDDICNGSVINYAYAIGTDTCGNSTLTSPNATVTIPTRPSGNISGMKFNDLDGNGTRDINDNALPGWTINLYYASNGTFITSVVTNATGEYLFQDLPCGIYRVNETQNASWNQTAPAGGNYTVEINGTSLFVTGRDFGNQQRIIKCACPTRAYYTYAQVGSLADHRINFTDKSTGYPVEWNWSFGDGTYSNLKNPQHQYASPGYYKVTEYVKVCGCTGQVYWTSYTRTSVRVR